MRHRAWLVERTVEAISASVMAAFERKIKMLEEDRILIAEQIALAGKPKHTFLGVVRTRHGISGKLLVYLE